MKNPDELFAKFLDSKDPDHLDHAFSALEPSLRRMALREGVPPDAADDVVQQSMLIAIERRDAFDPTQSASAWIRGILFNVARGHGRARRRRDVPLDSVEAPLRAPMEDSPEESVMLEEALDQLRLALGEMSHRDMSLLTDHLIDGRSPREIAERTGAERTTISVQLSRALDRLRRTL